jgi:hypothetical protein
MVIEWLLDFIEGGFNLLVGLFPVSTFNPVTSLGSMLGAVGGLNYFLPISEMVGAVVAFLLLGIPFMAVTLGVWIVAFIRGGSARA